MTETYAFAHRGSRLTIHLAQAEPEEPPARGVIYMYVADADEVAGEWRKAGLVVDGPEETDYGKREGSHTDDDGNSIRFGSPSRSSS